MSSTKSTLGFFNEKLTEFFKDLVYAFPEEKDLKLALEYIEFAKKSNPRLILDMFYENIYVGAHELIEQEDEIGLLAFSKSKIETQYNELSSALLVFDKHWQAMDSQNRDVIWKYVKVLCILCEKARR